MLVATTEQLGLHVEWNLSSTTTNIIGKSLLNQTVKDTGNSYLLVLPSFHLMILLLWNHPGVSGSQHPWDLAAGQVSHPTDSQLSWLSQTTLRIPGKIVVIYGSHKRPCHGYNSWLLFQGTVYTTSFEASCEAVVQNLLVTLTSWSLPLWAAL